jgi:ABC-type Mn2+/Zn2+ transport system permease subunit
MGVRSQTIHYFLMTLLSFSVVAALQTVGVILVVAMLIIPASTAYLLSNNLKVILVLSAVIGVVSALVGLCLAILVNTTPGPAMTVTAALIYGLAVLFAPKRGILVRSKR